MGYTSPFVSKERNKGLKEFEKFKKTTLYKDPELSKDEYLKMKNSLTEIIGSLSQSFLQLKLSVKGLTYDEIKHRYRSSEENIELIFNNELWSEISVFKTTGRIFSKEAEIEFHEDIKKIIEAIKGIDK